MRKQNCWEFLKCGRGPAGSNVKELGVWDAVQGGEKRQRIDTEKRGPICDKGARSSPHVHNADRGQRLKPGSHSRTADADQSRKLSFRWEFVAGRELTVFNQSPDESHDLLCDDRWILLVLPLRAIAPGLMRFAHWSDRMC